MVAAFSPSPHNYKKHPSTPRNSIRPPLSPSEKNSNNNNDANNANSNSKTKPKSKSITSHYFSSSSSSPFAHVSTPLSQITKTDATRSSSSTTTTRSLSVAFQTHSFSFQTTKPKPISQSSPKKPIMAKTQKLNSVSKSLECSFEKKDQVLATVRVIGHAVVFDEKVKRATYDGDDLYLVLETDSSNPEGVNTNNVSLKGRNLNRGISVPARFMDRPLKNYMGNAPSVLNFRVKKGEDKIEEAHSFRLLHNRYLQWRFVNAHIDGVLSRQRINAEKNLYNAWITTSSLHDSVANKRIELQNILHHLKLDFILRGQMTYLEEWSEIDEEQYKYLSGVIEALKASTIRLPVISGARVNIKDMKNAVVSAVDVMQAMGNSICILLSKVERTSGLVSELAKIVAQERDLLDQSNSLLSTIESMHVKQCSLQGSILQVNCSLDSVLL